MDDPTSATPMKPLRWVGTSKEELDAFPREARREAGYALYLAQIGMKARQSHLIRRKFEDCLVVEVVES
jgi:phage-related protein